jgi:hypothetical protein
MDFNLINGGSVFILIPNTEEANAWVADNLPAELLFLGNGIAVEHRYIAEIVAGIQNDGLTIN